MSETIYSFAVDEGLKEAFARAVGSRDGGEILQDFMRDFIQRQEAEAYDRWFRAEIEFAIEDANTNPCIPSEEVEAYFARKRQASLAPISKS